MKNPIWTSAIKTCAAPQRVKHFFDLLATTSAGEALHASSAERARVLAAVFSGSQALGNLLVARPDWLSVLEPEALKFPRRKQGLRNEVNRWMKLLLAASDYGAALTRLREFKQREMLRIGGRDLARLGKLAEILQEISHRKHLDAISFQDYPLHPVPFRAGQRVFSWYHPSVKK